ncbi:hypothetical protein GWI33_019269 [Rhynchophorus ferrugineus]|uniref:Uncharacterized protein n=1 Tax=Rhynchophorus ferrugineus TaxID=354439 RepID=A0A834HT45_RHYFE|nr:hypothetical protein GWI33_019269 [Rhynchophorus ferrugineus]
MISLIGSKLILALTNFLLLGCGFTLVTGAMLVLFDPERILLSKLLAAGPFSDLPHPMLYYVAIGLALLGLSLAAAGILGCWASCLHNYWLLSIGCQLKLEQWYREHYVAFLGIGLAVVLVEFFVLLSTILTCTRVYHHNQEQKENAKNTAQDSDAINTKDRIFQKKGSLTPGAYSNETYAMTDSYRQNYKLLERA